jgi:diguanylate cyclase (GGDEF)-like protein
MMKTTQPLCPCCSHQLLRHASYQRSYWFCRQCHQEMPDIENLVKPRLVPQHWTSQALERQQLKNGLQEGERLYFGLEDHKNIQRLAFSDSLTKIANRLKFQAYLNQEWGRMAQEQASLSIVLGDLDFFQAYNAHYGHQQGDRCLLKVAQAIVSVVKTSADLVPAYGGEEFVLILPRTKAAGAHRVAQELLDKIHSLKIPHLNSEISPYLTLSLGVASIIPSDQYSADLLINSADQALQQAKARGRNRLILHENILQQITIIESETRRHVAIE